MVSSIVHPKCYKKVLPDYPDQYFDWAICDPPYGVGLGSMPYLKELKNKKSTHKSFDWDAAPLDQAYYDELRRVSRHQIIFGIEYFDWKAESSGRIKWNKGVAEGMSFKGYEIAYCSSIDYQMDIDLLWSGMMQAKSLSEPMTSQGNKKLCEKRIHPCQKPRLLYRKLLKEFNIFGQKILDTHVGSGSLRIEADLADCQFVGSENDLDTWSKQEKRYSEHASQLRLKI